MDNPYRRLRELTTYSQKDFAAKFGFSKTVMGHIESGQFPSLSDDMITSLGRATAEKNINARQVLADEYNAQDLQTAYATWQSNERMQVSHLFKQSPSGQSTKARSPFSFYIDEVAGSRHQFCKLLKVPSASVLRYAQGATRTMPKAIEQALREVQFPYLQELKDMQEAWIDT